MTANTTLPVVQIRRRDLLLPLLLIALGAMFFAANLGYALPISARAVFGLWPVVLVVIGVEVALAQRKPYVHNSFTRGIDRKAAGKGRRKGMDRWVLWQARQR